MSLSKLAKLALILTVCCLAVTVNAQPETSAGSARLRVANYVVDAPALTVQVNGETITAEALTFTTTAPHADVPAGTVEINFLDGETVVTSTSATIEPGYEYTAALIGQIADATAQIILIPETEIVAGVRDLNNPASYAILLHGISDGPTVDFSLDGVVLREALSFGEYDVFSVTQEPHDILVTFTDDPAQVLFQNDGETPPANDLLLLTVMVGSYPDGLDVTGAVSRLPDRSVLDFLQTPGDAAGSSFTTLLKALEVTGLSEELAAQGAFTLFAPTDAAFAALPAETLDLLFAYPDALRAVLLGHVVDDVFALRELTDEQTVTTRQGTELRIQADGEVFKINDQTALLFGGFPVVTNGNVIGIDQILIPVIEN